MAKTEIEAASKQTAPAASSSGEEERCFRLGTVNKELEKVNFTGTVRVRNNAIEFVVPNPRGLTLDQVDRALASGNFCGGCHGVLTAVGDFIY